MYAKLKRGKRQEKHNKSRVRVLRKEEREESRKAKGRQGKSMAASGQDLDPEGLC